MEIRTNFDYPPIPNRNMDWSAWIDGSIDPDWDGESEQFVQPGLCVGHGRTEQEAIEDLKSQIQNK